MPRRPPPTPLVLAKGPLPPRGAPRHQLPDVPRAALIVAETAHRYSYDNNNTARHRLRSRERSASNASASSLSSNFSLPSSLSRPLSPYDDYPFVYTPTTRTRAISSDTTMMPTRMSPSWVALDAARRQVTPPPPVMLAYPISRPASGSGMKKGMGREPSSRRVSF